MTEYRHGWSYPAAFPPREPAMTMAEVISEAGGRQLHVAETEKYAHVTYFFNGGREDEWQGEERKLVDSPRDVPTYDLKPEMSAAGGRRGLLRRLGVGGGDVTASGSSTSPTRTWSATPASSRRRCEAIEAVDACLAKVVAAVHARGGACLITADHGNADYMLKPDGSPNTAHTTNPVPLIATVDGIELRRRAASSPTSRRPRWSCSGSPSRTR